MKAPFNIIDKLLKNYPVGTRIRSGRGLTPVHTALQFECSLETFEAIIEAGAKIKEDVITQVVQAKDGEMRGWSVGHFIAKFCKNVDFTQTVIMKHHSQLHIADASGKVRGAS